MFIGLNGQAHFACKFAFDNGWAITISARECGHVDYLIAPAHVFEPEFYHCSPLEAKTKLEILWKDAQERGDDVRHYNGSDREILDIISAVSERPDYMRKEVDDMIANIKVKRK